MQRREFFVLLGAATVAWPVAALAQPSERIRRVGILVGSGQSDPNIQAWIAEVQNGLAALGWREGQNVHFERRFAGGDVGRAQPHAQELVRLDLDVIVTSSTPTALALDWGKPVQSRSCSQIYPTRSAAVFQISRVPGQRHRLHQFRPFDRACG